VKIGDSTQFINGDKLEIEKKLMDGEFANGKLHKKPSYGIIFGQFLPNEFFFIRKGFVVKLCVDS